MPLKRKEAVARFSLEGGASSTLHTRRVGLVPAPSVCHKTPLAQRRPFKLRLLVVVAPTSGQEHEQLEERRAIFQRVASYKVPIFGS